ncbi:hypothetical protein D3C72_1255920 [compost metagenome]
MLEGFVHAAQAEPLQLTMTLTDEDSISIRAPSPTFVPSILGMNIRVAEASPSEGTLLGAKVILKE